jgi:ABC-type Na+ transport system ATPase subunit NatA
MLELQGLTRRYGDLVALDDLSFTVREGQMAASPPVVR